MNNVLELAKTDYKILEFINRNGSALPEVIQDNFHKIEEIEYRIRILRDNGYIVQDCDKLISGILIKATDTKSFRLTDKGLFVLRNHHENNKEYKAKALFENAWIPIAITLLTNLSIIGIQALSKLI